MLGMAIRKWCVRLIEDMRPPGAFYRTSDFHHLEIFLARAALRTRPIDRHVFPARSRRDAFVGEALLFLVYPAADEAHPRLVLHLIFGHRMGPDINPCHRWCSRSRRRIRPAAPACRQTSSPSPRSIAIRFP